MHPAVQRIADVWRGTRYEGKAFLVGGIVRDELLDGTSTKNDIDIVLEADALGAAELLHQSGITEHAPVVFQRFGTAMVRIDGTNVEFVTARKESYDEDSRKPHVEPATLLEDATRRDFTVNTLMRDVFTGELVDPLKTGLEDLNAKILRTPLDPIATFRDDPLRMLRAVRFKLQLGFAYAEGLEDAIKDQAHRLAVISEERIREEFTKMLGLPRASTALNDLLKLNLLDQFAPEFRAMLGCSQGSYHHLDVWDHTMLALDNAGHEDLELSLSVLFHDIGKPPTRTIDNKGQIRFFGHETVGEEKARAMLRRMKFDNSTIDSVALLVRQHMRLNSMPAITPGAARRIVRDLGSELDRWLALIEADANALKPGVKVFNVTEVRRILDEVRADTPASSLQSPLDGDEIMQLTGIAPGPQLGQLKNLLLEDILDGRLQPGDKSNAEARLMEHWRNVH